VDINEYISSGFLESYVMGLTSDEENRQIQKLLVEYPQLKTEIVAIEDVLLLHASQQISAPPSRIKNIILAQLPFSDDQKIIQHPASIPAQKTNGFFRFLAAASVTLFFISAITNIYLFNNLKKAEQQIASLNNEKTQLAQEFNVEQAKYKTMESGMSILQSPYNKLVMMKGLPVAPNSLAMIYWNTQTHEVFINVHQLPIPPQGKQYQLWALAGGKPIDAGVFDVSDSLLVQKMKVIDTAESFAVTLEDVGGSPTPTLTAMYLMGQI